MEELRKLTPEECPEMQEFIDKSSMEEGRAKMMKKVSGRADAGGYSQ